MLRRAPQRLASLSKCGQSTTPTRRLFATSIRRPQQVEGQDGRTTHFGFETISEAQKEARGMLLCPSAILLGLILLSRRCLLLCRVLVRQDE